MLDSAEKALNYLQSLPVRLVVVNDCTDFQRSGPAHPINVCFYWAGQVEEVRPLRAQIRALLETLDESAAKTTEETLTDEVERLRMQVVGVFSFSRLLFRTWAIACASAAYHSDRRGTNDQRRARHLRATSEVANILLLHSRGPQVRVAELNISRSAHHKSRAPSVIVGLKGWSLLMIFLKTC